MILENIPYTIMSNLSDIVAFGLFIIILIITTLICIMLISKNRIMSAGIIAVIVSTTSSILLCYTLNYINSHREDLYNHYISYEKLYNSAIVESSNGYVSLDLKTREAISSDYISYIVFKECKNFEIYKTNGIIIYNLDFITLKSKYVKKGIAFCVDGDNKKE